MHRGSVNIKSVCSNGPISMLVGPLMGIKDPGKVRNQRVAKSRIVLIPFLILNLIFVKKCIPRQLIHECRYCSINNTNELHLLVSKAFWVKKESTGGQFS